MKIYRLKRKQFLPISAREAWDFFSSPENLALITPSKLNFRILDNSGSDKMFEGQLIKYRVRVFPGISVIWVTELKEINEPFSFVDEQRKGPYTLWRHHHSFKEVEGGIEMNDDVQYAIPLGFLGRLANVIFVGREVKAIFDYRFRTLEKHFPVNKTKRSVL